MALPSENCPSRATYEKVIRESMVSGHPTIEKIAHKLGIPVRTMQRRLHNAGLTYSELVDTVRYNAACRALNLTPKTITEIAKELGFTDTSNFSRAFLRWSGMTPTAYRSKDKFK